MNSTRAAGAQPQNRHFVHTGSIARLQPPQIFCGLLEPPRFATRMRTTSTTNAAPTMMATRPPSDTALDDRLELELRLADHHDVVVDEIVLRDFVVVDVRAVRRAVVEQREAVR